MILIVKEITMQVFISDVHLTDGTSGTTINADAFKLLRDNVEDLIERRKPKELKKLKELKIVLLGDIFDVIRSTKWPTDGNSPVQPWYPRSDAQEAVVQKIVNDIITNNQQSLNWIKSLGQLALTFDLQYVIGNHDWLINRYPKIVKTIASALDITPPPVSFPEKIPASGYKTFAIHGDKYDKTNYMKNRDESSIGDVIVIKLLNQFPIEVGKKLPGQQNIIDELKEIDNVRPMSDIPSWILMVLNKKSDFVQSAINNAWRECVNEFLKVDFIRKMGIFTKCKLWLEWQLSSYILKFKLEKFTRAHRFILRWLEVRYDKKAWAEPAMRSGQAKYIIYGHTHEHLIVPMDQVRLSTGTEDKIYFNTGTWRQTWNKAVFDKAHREFVGWKVLTYIAFYNEEENKAHDHKFDVWNGALG